MTLLHPPTHSQTSHRYKKADEWWHALGDVPLDRVLFDPIPGLATEADLLRLVQDGDTLCELIEGTLVEKPVGYFESKIAMNLVVILGAFVREKNLGDVLGPDATLRMKLGNRIRLPDVSFVSRERLPKHWIKVPVLAPDLAVEVLSEGNTAAEIDQKLLEYFASGTILAWIIQPEDRTVAIYRSASGPAEQVDIAGILSGEEVVPGFSVPVAALFEGVPDRD